MTGDQTVTYARGVKAVFRALAAPPRRRLLDELFKEDGQTLRALERRLPMTRFGVMKHLRVLEEARRYLDRISRQWDGALARLRGFVEE